MFLLVGLGNPGEAYAHHRHNVGFRLLETLASDYACSPFRKRFSGLLSEGKVRGQNILLFKPQKYMNVSGPPVGEALRFFKVPLENLIVFHDELDLSPLKVRVKTGGGAAGHNGLRSLDQIVGNAYQRVRIGIGHPGDKQLVHNYVLGNLTKKEEEDFNLLWTAISENLSLLLERKESLFQTNVHLRLQKHTS